MFNRVRIAAKFFTLGLIVGVLFAPGAGMETRARLRRLVSDRSKE